MMNTLERLFTSIDFLCDAIFPSVIIMTDSLASFQLYLYRFFLRIL